jgi:uncharacterized protein (TIGR02271 family)
MGSTTHSIDVNAPLRAVYNQWTQFEEFPRFMEGVEEVRQEGEKRLFWRAKIGGKVKEWEAEIINQVPDEGIAWQSVDGSPNSGTIIFEELDSEPEGLLEKTGDVLGIPSGRVEGDLERFREFIEERGRESGGWRGEIREGETPYPSVAPTGTEKGSLSRTAEQPYQPERELSEIRERTSGTRAGESGGEIVAEVPLSQEEVKVGKRTVAAGEVRVRKTVSTEQVNVPVELKREDAVIERIPAHEVGQTGKEAFQEERIEVPLSREEPVVEKETRVTGGVRVRKTEDVKRETIQESVRREDVDIDESGKASGSRKGRPGIDPETGEEKL